MERIKSSLSYAGERLSQKWTMLGALGIVAALSWVALYASAKTGQLQVHFFDVGQGDAIFIEMPDGRQILIDSGFDNKVVEKLGGVMPFYDRDIDIVIATHNDADHIGGLPAVLGHYEVEMIIWNGVEARTKIFEELRSAIDNEGAEVIVGRCCMRFALSKEAFFEIVYPMNSDINSSPSVPVPQNNYSIVIRFVYGDDSFLFTGDIERQSEYEIVSQNFNIESDVLKIPHHGSKTSSSELFLEKVNPKIAVISAGRENPYGHPHAAIIERLGKFGIRVRGTYKEGDVQLESNGDSF